MNTEAIATEIVTTHELREGDVVHVYGLRVRLGTVQQTRHAVTEHGGATFYSNGEILNAARLQTDEGRQLFGGIIKLDGSDGWTIQGNGLAMWAREVRGEYDAAALEGNPASNLGTSDAEPPLTEAETVGRATGSVAATVTHERRELDGSLTVQSVETFERNTDGRA